MQLTDPDKIQYTFGLGEETVTFTIETSKQASQPSLVNDAANTLPDWTRLESSKCPNCPLKTTDCAHCPAAVRVHEVLQTFHKSASIEQIELTVVTSRRILQQKCDLQSALNSMLGLQLATSGCPILENLRGMANFHLPFCSFSETLYRTVGAYLTQQYFIYKEGREADWDLQGLKAFYKDLETLNQAFSQRIQAIEQSDAASNAIVMFFAASIEVAEAIDSGLEEFKDYFSGKTAHAPI